jgi:hypothetical protein
LTFRIGIELNIVAGCAKPKVSVEGIDCAGTVGWYKDSTRHQPTATVRQQVRTAWRVDDIHGAINAAALSF